MCNAYAFSFWQISVIILFWFLPFQGVEDSRLPVPYNAGPGMAETSYSVADTVSPSLNTRLASAVTTLSASIVTENASTLASLCMVY